EHRLVAAPPLHPRGGLVERELLEQVGAARVVELVVVGLGERGELEAGDRLDAAGPQLAAVQAVAIVLRDAGGGGADPGPGGARRGSGDRGGLAGAGGAAGDAGDRTPDAGGGRLAPDADREHRLLRRRQRWQRVVDGALHDVERDAAAGARGDRLG